MQAIPSPVEAWHWKDYSKRAGGWVYHNLIWFAAIGLAFYVGQGVNNGEATKTAVTSVQKTYQGKVEYHVQHEKVLAKTAKTAIVACERNLGAALSNAASVQEVNGCPPPNVVPPVK